MSVIIRKGDTIMLTSAQDVNGHWIRPEEVGEYCSDGERLVRLSDGYVLPVAPSKAEERVKPKPGEVFTWKKPEGL